MFKILGGACSFPLRLHTTPTTSSIKGGQPVCILKGENQGEKVLKLIAAAR